jgi:hypothetical protein
MEMKVQRWLAVWYRCPRCGLQTAQTRMAPTKRNRDDVPECYGYDCDLHKVRVLERRYYTTFAIEPGISATFVVGTLKRIGPFKVCDIVHPNIRAFRTWYRQRKVELDEQARQDEERQRQIEEEERKRRERKQAQAVLVQEAERIAWRRAHAIELEAEQIARALWPETKQEAPNLDDDLGDFDEAPF